MTSKDRQVNALKRQREGIQTKTFTKWMNSHLDAIHFKPLVEDMFSALDTGVVLHKLLQKLSGEEYKLPNVAKGTRALMRFHKVENIEAAMKFIRDHDVRLEAMGGQDIVDGNITLTLGLIWNIILRFQIADIEIEGEDAKSAKEALLRWCQRKTAGYPGVRIDNFTTSWRDGLAFNAIIHKHRPDLIDFKALKPEHALKNLKQAFDIAERELGIVSLLDPEDVLEMCDEKSIMTYLVGYYHKFAKMEQDNVWQKRLQNAMQFQVETEIDENDFELHTAGLIKWISEKIASLKDRNFENSLTGVKNAMQDFKEYRVVEKPPRFVQKGDLEAQLFAIHTKRRFGNRRTYHVPEGRDIKEINALWEKLEKEEHERENALRDELRRQERLEQLAAKFRRKAELRDDWMAERDEMMKLDEFGTSLAEIQASLKKEDMAATEVDAYTDRFEALHALKKYLKDENYHSVGDIEATAEDLDQRWGKLLELLEMRRFKLNELHQLLRVHADMDDAIQYIEQTSQAISSAPLGQQVEDVVELQDLHKQLETDLSAYVHATNDSLASSVQALKASKHSQADVISAKHHEIKKAFAKLERQAEKRRDLLDQNLQFATFMQDCQAAQAWISGRLPEATSTDLGNSLDVVLKSVKRNEILETDTVAFKRSTFDAVVKNGNDLIAADNYASENIQQAVEDLKFAWANISSSIEQRKIGLALSLDAHQYFIDSNEVDSWLVEKTPFITSEDYGKNEHASWNLLQQFSQLRSDLEGYAKVITRLQDQCNAVCARQKPDSALVREACVTVMTSSTAATPMPTPVATPVKADAKKKDKKKKPKQTAVAQYAYEARRDKELSLSKGDHLVIKSMKDDKWWKVVNAAGKSGYVPASYVKLNEMPPEEADDEPEPEPEPVPVSAPVTPVKTKTLKRTHSIVSSAQKSAFVDFHDFEPDVVKRQHELEDLYTTLATQAAERGKILEEYVAFHAYRNETENLLAWLDEQKAIYDSNDIGTTPEQTSLHLKAFDKFNQQSLSNQQRYEEIMVAAASVVANEEHTHRAAVADYQSKLEAAWQHMLEKRAVREGMLSHAAEVHEFNKSLEELNEEIREKDAHVSEDLGRDVDSVAALLRQHSAFSQEVHPFESEMEKLKVKKEKVAMADEHSDSLLSAVESHFGQLSGKVSERAVALENALKYQEFHADHSGALAWIESNDADVRSLDLHDNIAAAEMALKQVEELKLEMDPRYAKFEELAARGDHLCTEGHPMRDAISSESATLRESVAASRDAWEEKHRKLAQCLSLRQFEAAHYLASSTLERQAADLKNDDLGDSEHAVQSLAKTQHALAQQIAKSAEEVQEVEVLCEAMVACDHYDKENVLKLTAELRTARQEVEDTASRRTQLLDESLLYQAWLRDEREFSSWAATQQSAADEKSYLDKLNLKGKLRLQLLVEEDVKTHKNVRASLESRVADAEKAGVFAAPDMRKRMEEVNSAFATLVDATKEKTARIHESIAEQKFARGVEDFIEWEQTVLKELAIPDVGTDRISANSLLKKHQMLAADIKAHEKFVDEIDASAQTLVGANNFEAEKIAALRDGVLERYAALHAPTATRMKALTDSSQWQEYLSRFRDDMAWCDERKPRVSSSEVGEDLSQAQALLKAYKVFHAELESYRDLVQATVDFGKSLLAENANGDAIAEKNGVLEAEYEALHAASSERMRVLTESHVAHTFFVECEDAIEWCRAHLDQAASTFYGDDEAETLALIAKNNVLDSDVAAQRVIASSLAEKGNALIQAGNVSKEAILAKAAEVDSVVAEIEAATAQRKRCLRERELFHQLSNSVSESLEWIDDCFRTASRTDIGEDISACQLIVEQFDDFETMLASNADDRVNTLVNTCEARQGHVDASDIQEQKVVLQLRWEELLTRAQERRAQLEAASEVHTFVADCGEVLVRVEEKHGPAFFKDYGGDLSSNEVLTRAHQGFELAANALEPNVAAIRTRAEELAPRHPASAQDIRERTAALDSAWAKLREGIAERSLGLERTHKKLSFLSQYRAFMAWVDDTTRVMKGYDMPTSLDTAVKLQESHAELHAEVQTREPTLNALCDFGERIASTQPDDASEVLTNVASLRTEYGATTALWAEVDHALNLTHDSLLFEEKAKMVEGWLQGRDVILGASEIDDETIASGDVDAMLAKHNELEVSLDVYAQKFATLRELTKFEAEALSEDDVSGHYARFEEMDREEAKRERELQSRREMENQRQQALLEAEQERRFAMEEAQRQERSQQAAQAAVQSAESIKAAAQNLVEKEEDRRRSLSEQLRRASENGSEAATARQSLADEVKQREELARIAREAADKKVHEVDAYMHKADFLPPLPGAVDAEATMQRSKSVRKSLRERKKKEMPVISEGEPGENGVTPQPPAPISFNDDDFNNEHEDGSSQADTGTGTDEYIDV